MIRTPLASLLLTLVFAGSAVAEAPRTIRMEVNGLVCAFCAHGIQRALEKYPAAGEVFVDLEDRLVAVELEDGGDITDADLGTAMNDAGYTVVSIARSVETLDAIKAAQGATDE
ncbi:MAG: heavy-metal-associated domain-containing protein [Pseudomonadota bacterium]|jgi:copper chaperone CopZ